MSALTRTSAVAAATAAAALLAVAVPVSAHADQAQYPPLKPDIWSVTIHPDTVVTHNVPGNTFNHSCGLQLAVTGTSPAPTLATFASASQLAAPMSSDSAGGAVVKLDFGLTTRGVYDVTLAQSCSGSSSYGVVTVIPDAAAAVDAPDAATAQLAGALPQTGTSINLGVLWGAAAAIVVGGAIWIGAAVRRRIRIRGGSSIRSN